MFKKRQTRGQSYRQVAKLETDVKTEHDSKLIASHSDDEEATEELKRIQDVKDRHRLRQRVKGLATSDRLSVESKLGLSTGSDQSKFDLLDKSFRQQGERTETKIDQHL